MFLASLPWSERVHDFVAGDALVLAGAGGGGEGEEFVSGGAPALACVVQGGDDESGFLEFGRSAGLPAPPGGACRAQGAQGGGVAAALGGEVAAEAEHVCPSAQGLEIVVGVVAEPPGGGNEPALMCGRPAVDGEGGGGDPGSARADGLGGFGGVLGQV